MNNFQNNIFINWLKNNSIILMWFVIIIFPLLFLWQGFNFSDEGNALTIYQSIFASPSSVSDTFGTYGTSIIGGIWLKFFGDFGVTGVRFAGALVSILTIVFAYFILQEYIDKKLLLLSFLASFLFSYRFLTMNLLGYNNLSALFFVIAIFFLAKGLKNNSALLIFLSGFILFLNILVRLPNVLGLLFIFAIPLDNYIKKYSDSIMCVKQCIIFLLGTLSGYFVMIYIMKALGHYEYYLQSLYYLLDAMRPGNPHSHLLFETIKGYSNLFGDAILLFFLIVFTIFLYFYFKLNKLNIFVKSFLILLPLFLLYIKYNPWGVPIGFRFVELLAGICYAVLIIYQFRYKNENKNLNIIAFLILIALAVIPAASGARQINSLFMIPIAFPLALNYIYNIKKIKFSFDISNQETSQKDLSVIEIKNETFKKIVKSLLIIFIMYSVVNAFAFTYDEPFNRFSLNTKINHKYTRGIYTTKEKAESLNEFILEYPKYIKNGDTILVAWINPMIYYLTDTRPYFPHPWTEIYKKNKIENFLNKKSKNEKLPVVIRYNHSQKHAYDDALFQFFQKNFYEKKWGNEVYEIYAPNVSRL